MNLHENRLIRETSPYLLQHARNPVDWFPWGDEAFEKAAREEKPVFLSIGYSTCHWCHVMERESFENEKIAKEYGFAAARLATFTGSYHGAASRFGDATVANCASCHGSHGIRPSSDPKSSINPANLTRTCGKCHPGASANFAVGKMHVDAKKKEKWADARKQFEKKEMQLVATSEEIKKARFHPA
jgi:hypothetical protein